MTDTTRTPPAGWTPTAFETATVDLVGMRDHLHLAHWIDLPEGPTLATVHDALHDEPTQHEMGIHIDRVKAFRAANSTCPHGRHFGGHYCEECDRGSNGTS